MKESVFKELFDNMDISAAIFRIEMESRHKIKAPVILDCNRHYLDIAGQRNIPRDGVIGKSYYDIAPNHDPRWDYYFYQSAIKRKHVHGEFRNREMGYWMEISGGPAEDEDTCWMVFIDQTKYKNASDRYLELSMMDQLTGIRNRNAYEDVLEAYRAAQVPVGVIMADLNGLKEQNDSEGHEAGDRMLEKAARFLCSVTGKDLPFRIGGDEFAVLLEDLTKDETLEIRDRIRACTEVSISCGCSWTDNSAAVDETIREADADMYEDKKAYYRTHDRRHVQ